MAILHVKTPNGTTKTVDLETMNITSSLQQNGWCKLPNGLIIQWGEPGDVVPKTGFVGYSITFPRRGICAVLTGHISGFSVDSSEVLTLSYSEGSTASGLYIFACRHKQDGYHWITNIWGNYIVIGW